MRALAQRRRDPGAACPPARRRGRGAAGEVVQREEGLHASIRYACAGVRQDAQTSRGAFGLASL